MKGICLFYFLSIPNGPAGLLVSVNEEPVMQLGFFVFFLSLALNFESRKAELTHTHTHTALESLPCYWQVILTLSYRPMFS